MYSTYINPILSQPYSNPAGSAGLSCRKEINENSPKSLLYQKVILTNINKYRVWALIEFNYILKYE